MPMQEPHVTPVERSDDRDRGIGLGIALALVSFGFGIGLFWRELFHLVAGAAQ